MTRILVVDDDPEITKLLEKFLSNEGYEVSVASNGAGALSAAGASEPDLVILDIVLGNEDGREVLRELRLISDVPTIFLTGRGLESERIAGLKLGADDYMVKPFSLGEMSARIESILRRSGVNTSQHHIEAPNIVYGHLADQRKHARGATRWGTARPDVEGVRASQLHGGHAPTGVLPRATPRTRVGLVE